MAQLEHIEAIEKRLWSAADTLRANSNYAGNEYFLPVMGLVFLRHAYSRYLGVKDAIEAGLPTRGGKTRPLTKEDFSQKSAIFLQPKAQFDTLVALPDSADRAKAIIDAMESIEADYENLRGVLPKSEYQELDNVVLGQLLRTLNPEELKRVSGDVFGPHLRILPDPVCRPEGPRRWRVLHSGVAGLADRQRHRNRPAAHCSTRPAARAVCSCRAPGWWSGGTKIPRRSSPSTAWRKTPPPSAWPR